MRCRNKVIGVVMADDVWYGPGTKLRKEIVSFICRNDGKNSKILRKRC